MRKPNVEDDYLGLEQDLADLHRSVLLDPGFVARVEAKILDHAAELSSQTKAKGTSPWNGWIARLLSTSQSLAWGAAGILLVLVVAWGIQYLLPRSLPASPAPTPTSTPASQSLPLIEEILARGEALPFEVCGESTSWERPPEQEQREKWWKSGRFSGLSAEILNDFWTRHFFVDYGSADAAFDRTNLTGLWMLPDEARAFCLTSDRQDSLLKLKMAELWSLSYTVKSVHRIESHYVVVVERVENGVQFVQFERTERQEPLTIHIVQTDGAEIETLDEAKSSDWPNPQLIPHPDRPSNTPKPTTQTSALSVDSSHDEIRQHIINPTWQTLWIQGQAKITSSTDVQHNFYVQAWLDRSGAGRVLSTDQIPGDLNFNLDMLPRWIWVSDGQVLSLFDVQAGQFDPSTANQRWFVHPLETAGQAMVMLFPSYLAVRSEDLQVVELSEQAGRPALVVDWAYFRLWVDTQTGVILRQQTRDENGQAGEDIFLTAIAYDLPLPDGVLSTENLAQSRFEPPPDREILPELPVLDPGSRPPSDAGEIYFELSGEPPFQWRMAALPAGCLASGSACTNLREIPERPKPQLFLSWSHAGRKAVFSDTNFDQLWAFDPAAHRWQVVVNDSYQMQLAWSQDDRRLAAATVESDPNHMNLVWIDTEGWSVHAIPTSLKGNKEVIAWLDEHTLAVTVLPDSFKGGEPEWTAEFQPGPYRVDVETGEFELVRPWNGDHYFAPASLSPDGRYFLVGEAHQGQQSLALANLDFQQVRSLNVSGDAAQWSPDGEWISLINTEQYLSLVRLDGTQVETGLTQVLKAVWSPDSGHLLIQTGDADANDRLWLVSTGGEVRQVEIPALKESYIWSLLGWQRLVE